MLKVTQLGSGVRKVFEDISICQTLAPISFTLYLPPSQEIHTDVASGLNFHQS